MAKYRDNLKSLRGIFVDCGWRDQYHIHYGSRILSKRLPAAGIRHTCEEFDDDHSDIDYPMDVSLPFLYWALKPQEAIDNTCSASSFEREVADVRSCFGFLL